MSTLEERHQELLGRFNALVQEVDKGFTNVAGVHDELHAKIDRANIESQIEETKTVPAAWKNLDDRLASLEAEFGKLAAGVNIANGLQQRIAELESRFERAPHQGAELQLDGVKQAVNTLQEAVNKRLGVLESRLPTSRVEG